MTANDELIKILDQAFRIGGQVQDDKEIIVILRSAATKDLPHIRLTF